jgi:PadR family transcriptional regulator PadR
MSKAQHAAAVGGFPRKKSAAAGGTGRGAGKGLTKNNTPAGKSPQLWCGHGISVGPDASPRIVGMDVEDIQIPGHRFHPNTTRQKFARPGCFFDKNTCIVYYYALYYSIQNTVLCSVKLLRGENREAMNVQFKKGVLELCVLVVLCRRDYYGYELVHTISENIDIAEGTIYPLLRRLTKEGYFTTYLRESEEGPSRKYYQITEKGQDYKEQLLAEWNHFVSSVHNLIQEEETA